MNTVQLLRDAGPEGPALATGVRTAARAALLAEIEGAQPRRSRMPSRKVRWRIGIGLVTAAAAWGAAVVIAAPDGPGTPAESVTLVDFHTPTFPLSLDPEPEGLHPAFTGDATGSTFAEYEDHAGNRSFLMAVGEDEPDLDELNAGLEIDQEREVSVDGQDATLVRGSHGVPCEDGLSMCGTRDFTQLVWEFEDEVWVLLEGEGVYSDPDRLIDVAESVVDRPQRATLTAELAPAGWSVVLFKMGRVLILANDSFEAQTITVQVPLPQDVIPADQLADQLMGVTGASTPVTVHGRPATLVDQQTDYMVDGEFTHQWFLQAQFEDGRVYELQVPDAFTRQQVLEFAEAVTYHP